MNQSLYHPGTITKGPLDVTTFKNNQFGWSSVLECQTDPTEILNLISTSLSLHMS